MCCLPHTTTTKTDLFPNIEKDPHNYWWHYICRTTIDTAIEVGTYEISLVRTAQLPLLIFDKQSHRHLEKCNNQNQKCNHRIWNIEYCLLSSDIFYIINSIVTVHSTTALVSSIWIVKSQSQSQSHLFIRVVQICNSALPLK